MCSFKLHESPFPITEISGLRMSRLKRDRKNTISKLMERISLKATLSQRYTNHCVRASTITTLYQQGIDVKQICAITKHRDERSLKHYTNQTTSAQKRECSRRLNETFTGNTSGFESISTPLQMQQLSAVTPATITAMTVMYAYDEYFTVASKHLLPGSTLPTYSDWNSKYLSGSSSSVCRTGD